MIQYFRVKSGSVLVAAIIHGTFNGTVGISLVAIDNFNDLLAGGPGLAGVMALIVVDLVLFVIDRYVTRDKIFSSPLRAV